MPVWKRESSSARGEEESRTESGESQKGILNSIARLPPVGEAVRWQVLMCQGSLDFRPGGLGVGQALL